MSIKNGHPQLTIRVVNKLMSDIECYKETFGGGIYYDASTFGCYIWSVQSREEVLRMLDYYNSSTFRSYKSNRFRLIQEYYKLVDLRVYKEGSPHEKV
jgi:hypothetical protein